MQCKNKFIAILFSFLFMANIFTCSSQNNSQADLKRMTSIPLHDDEKTHTQKSGIVKKMQPVKAQKIDRGDILVNRNNNVVQYRYHSTDSDLGWICPSLWPCFDCMSNCCCKPCYNQDEDDSYRIQKE